MTDFHGTIAEVEQLDPIQMGFWMPSRAWATKRYLVPLRRELAERLRVGTLPALTPVMTDFKQWIEDNSIYRMWVHKMLNEANAFMVLLRIFDPEAICDISKDGDFTGVLRYNELFLHLNVIITTSPGFNETAMVGTPMNGLLAVSMGTPSGVALFHDATFNAQFKTVLNAWNAFLKSGQSLDKLDITAPEKPGSWISKAAHEAGVWTDMVQHPHEPAYGYDSWNSFFIRPFVPGARPFHGEADRVVNIGCETTPWQYQTPVRKTDAFWIKAMPYSLLDLFGGDEALADTFAGGQIYQGFLSATHYHRWRAPLRGKILRSWVEPGTYFAQRPGQGEGQGTWEGTESQPYLGHVAARAIFVMEHDAFGMVAMICIGMVEVSTCYITPAYAVPEGAPAVAIERGDPIGHFEFGGSTHAMIFQKDRAVLEDWAVNAVALRDRKTPIKLGTVIATLPGR